MSSEKIVSADHLTWSYAYVGDVKVHPKDDLESDAVFTSKPNGCGVELVLVAKDSELMTAHFRRKYALSSEYLNSVRANIHDRVISVVAEYVNQYGSDALAIILPAGIPNFKFSECVIEPTLSVGGFSYRPDLVLYQPKKSMPRIELEIIFTHDIDRDRRELIANEGHFLLSINIASWVNELAHNEVEDVCDEEILDFVRRKGFSYYTKKQADRARRVWKELLIIDEAEKLLPVRIDGLDEHETFGVMWDLSDYKEKLRKIIDKDYSDYITKKASLILTLLEQEYSEVKELWSIGKKKAEAKRRKVGAKRREVDAKRREVDAKSREADGIRRDKIIKKSAESKVPYILDVETYVDYFLVLFKRVRSEEIEVFELYQGHPLDVDSLSAMMEENITVGFNSNSYDLYMIAGALKGKTNEELKALSDRIIMSQNPPWMFAERCDCEIPKTAYGKTLWNHIDLINVAPGQASLKIYGGRMNSKRLQDLPYEHTASITPEMRDVLRVYCRNDLDTTEDMWNALREQLKLRREMSKKYRIDLRSKSDAQIAEAVFRKEIGDLEGRQVRPPKRIDRSKTYRYLNPKIIEFRSQDLQDTLYAILDTEFKLTEKASIQLPTWLAEKKIEIGGSQYQMGIGGLHSCEKKRHIVCDEDHVLRDADVASYYPSIILQQGLIPENIGEGFTKVYSDIYHTRLAAKASGDKVTANSLKITLNGSFGKLGSKYSALYAPDLLIQTTITGQLSLLMLIEMLEDKSISVVSANTDGIVVYFPKTLQRTYEEVCWDWELRTSYELEFTDYRGLYSRDVNSYIAIKPDGSIKGKGAFADPTMMKNPQFVIVNDAIKAYLGKGTPIEATVMSCQDVTKFLMVRNVTGGAVWQDDYLGKAVRFYYSNAVDPETCIRYAKNGNKVPISDGCRPMMELTDSVPKDMDRARYIRMAKETLKDFGL